MKLLLDLDHALRTSVIIICCHTHRKLISKHLYLVLNLYIFRPACVNITYINIKNQKKQLELKYLIMRYGL